MHQELQLVPDLTVAQNVFLGIEDKRFGILRNTEKQRLAGLMAASGFDLDPDAVASSLSIADRQKIQILRALARDAKLIVMDEPTSSQAKDEVAHLHDRVRALRADGRTVIYVSHFLDDILAVSDRVTVLRHGDRVLTAPAATLTKGDIMSAILGDSNTEKPFSNNPLSGDPAMALEVSGLTNATLRNVYLTLRKGEIVELIGLVGSGTQRDCPCHHWRRPQHWHGSLRRASCNA